MNFFSAIRTALACAAVAAAAVPAQAQAQDWRQVSGAADGTAVYADPRRVVRTGDRVETWLRFTYPTDQRLETGEVYRSSLLHVDLECTRSRWRLLQSAFHDASGRVVYQEAEGTSWMGIIPQSVLERAANALCGRTPRAAAAGSAAAPALRFGALAAGPSGTGWSVDYANQTDADNRAISECSGANCQVVVRIAGPQCGAYATSPTSYGWAVAATRAQAEADALANCERARRSGRPCGVAVWACNGRD